MSQDLRRTTVGSHRFNLKRVIKGRGAKCLMGRGGRGDKLGKCWKYPSDAIFLDWPFLWVSITFQQPGVEITWKDIGNSTQKIVLQVNFLCLMSDLLQKF